ncbi:protein GLUTAMINE DUMPER 3 [Senna tora]|uniref:Protein GLUTAMINE DUMPER 3 n=1 Tax=Senna tora TaxID=362788 RepID=A0A834SPK9_9FABA|nr:protein GLUTAMINE DUMPER 3 [Senna tora]
MTLSLKVAPSFIKSGCSTIANPVVPLASSCTRGPPVLTFFLLRSSKSSSSLDLGSSYSVSMRLETSPERREPIDESPKSPVSPAPPLHSPWHSPVPYLFGGLAAMLGLIAFALLILACSYWKLSGYLDGDGDGDIESGSRGAKTEQQTEKSPAVYEEKILVIMAGQEKPTFLATPMWSHRNTSTTTTCSCDHKTEQETAETTTPKPDGIDGHDQNRSSP